MLFRSPSFMDRLKKMKAEYNRNDYSSPNLRSFAKQLQALFSEVYTYKGNLKKKVQSFYANQLTIYDNAIASLKTEIQNYQEKERQW